MSERTFGILKTLVWSKLETYLENPGCNLEGDLIGVHSSRADEDLFFNAKSFSSCKLNPEFVERLNITNAFAQCRDKGIISESDYEFVKAFAEGNYKEGARHATYHYNTVMHRACEAMVPMVFPKQHELARGGLDG